MKRLLNAKMKNGKIISTADDWTIDELQELRKKTTFQCPVCGSQVQLKLGLKRVWHFSHYQNRTCNIETEQETLYHLNGKRQLYRWLQQQHYQVALEVYLPIIRQRPDILLKVEKSLYALEFQCSAISFTEIRKRNAGYRQIGIEPIWILGGNRLKRKSKTLFSVQSFEWESIRSRIHEQLQFLYYCPNSQKWTFLKNIFPPKLFIPRS